MCPFVVVVVMDRNLNLSLSTPHPPVSSWELEWLSEAGGSGVQCELREAASHLL